MDRETVVNTPSRSLLPPLSVDRAIAALDGALRTLAAPPRAARVSPAEGIGDEPLSETERKTSAALMRVNHAGEVAAQALYHGQSLTARSESVRAQLSSAAKEEQDHLAWCRERLETLEARPSLLDPVWYAGGFALGAVTGLLGDRVSLGFVEETERQVVDHLADHRSRLPEADKASAAILEQMSADEAHHGTTAKLAGGEPLPVPVRRLMSLGGELLRRVAERV